MTRRLDPNALYWSEQGQIGCAEHTPWPGSDTWRWDGWVKVPQAALDEWLEQEDEPMRCEVCHHVVNTSSTPA